MEDVPSKRECTRLLIDESPLVLLPSLATRVGLNKAVVLQQVQYWISNPKVQGKVIDGHKWVSITHDEWIQNFPFWSRSTILSTVKHLEADGLLLTGFHSGNSFDRTKFYRINYDALDKVNATPPKRKSKNKRKDYPNFGEWAKKRRSNIQTLDNENVQTLEDDPIETNNKTTLSRVAEAPRETAPEPTPPKPEDDPAKRNVHIDALMESISNEPESPVVKDDAATAEGETSVPPRAPHPPGHYTHVGDVWTGPFNNYNAARRFAPTGVISQTPPIDVDVVAPANPGKKTSDAPRPIKRDALFVAVARYLSLPEETPEAPYPATRCKRVNQIKGCVLDVAGRPDKPDYAALAAKLDGFATWCKAQGFSAPKEETKFTGQFNTYYRSANGNGNGGALPRDDFPEKWYSSRMAYYKREGGQLYRKPIGYGADWSKAGEDD